MKWIYCDINNISDEEYAIAYRALSPSRRERVNRIQNTDDKKRSLAGEILAKKLLLEEYVIDNPQITIDTKGKPQAEGAPHFSIAHCQDIAVCAADDSEIGLDIEKIRAVKHSLIKRVCVDEELEYVLGSYTTDDNLCEDLEILAKFFEIWTAKEAHFKKIGTGITNFKSVNTRAIKKQFFTLNDYLICIVF